MPLRRKKRKSLIKVLDGTCTARKLFIKLTISDVRPYKKTKRPTRSRSMATKPSHQKTLWTDCSKTSWDSTFLFSLDKKSEALSVVDASTMKTKPWTISTRETESTTRSWRGILVSMLQAFKQAFKWTTKNDVFTFTHQAYYNHLMKVIKRIRQETPE